jgi:hypothetical protein
LAEVKPKSGAAIGVKQIFGYYEAHTGNNHGFDNRASGAYIFRPATQKRKEFTPHLQPIMFKGPLLQEIQQVRKKPLALKIMFFILLDNMCDTYLLPGLLQLC